jgi:hypothetical protein
MADRDGGDQRVGDLGVVPSNLSRSSLRLGRTHSDEGPVLEVERAGSRSAESDQFGNARVGQSDAGVIQVGGSQRLDVASDGFGPGLTPMGVERQIALDGASLSGQGRAASAARARSTTTVVVGIGPLGILGVAPAMTWWPLGWLATRSDAGRAGFAARGTVESRAGTQPTSALTACTCQPGLQLAMARSTGLRGLARHVLWLADVAPKWLTRGRSSDELSGLSGLSFLALRPRRALTRVTSDPKRSAPRRPSSRDTRRPVRGLSSTQLPIGAEVVTKVENKACLRRDLMMRWPS